jgi:Family of unknown function (DUF5678)
MAAQNHDLAEVLKDAPVGEWIALSDDLKKIVGTGKELQDALDAARQHGEEHPVVLKVPPADALIV